MSVRNLCSYAALPGAIALAACKALGTCRTGIKVAPE